MSLLSLLFSCTHPKKMQSRTFTIKNRSYFVCLSCGTEFDFSPPNIDLNLPERTQVGKPQFQPEKQQGSNFYTELTGIEKNEFGLL